MDHSRDATQIQTKIQSQAIPAALAGNDLIGCAQTGTGKTAAFVLRILDRLSHERNRSKGKRAVRSLILTPTRELAVQIERSILGYGRFTDLKTLAADMLKSPKVIQIGRPRKEKPKSKRSPGARKSYRGGRRRPRR